MLTIRNSFGAIALLAWLGAAPLMAAQEESAPKGPGVELPGEVEVLEDNLARELEALEPRIEAAVAEFTPLIAVHTARLGEELALSMPGMMLSAVPAADPEERRLKRERHEQQINMFRLWRIINDVKLSDEQVDWFFPLWRTMQREESRLSEQRHQLFRQLDEELRAEKPNEGKLDNLVKEIRENSRQIWQNKHQIHEQAMEKLDAQQRARFLMATNDLERDIWRALARVQNDFPNMPGPPGVPGAQFDKQKFQEQMEQWRLQLQEINQELRARGLKMDPEPDLKPADVPRDKGGKQK